MSIFTGNHTFDGFFRAGIFSVPVEDIGIVGLVFEFWLSWVLVGGTQEGNLGLREVEINTFLELVIVSYLVIYLIVWHSSS